MVVSYDASRWLYVQRLRRRPPSQGSGVASLSPQDDVQAPRSLRSARRQHQGCAVNAPSEPARRGERLYVRLTAEEAAHVAYLADARGLTVSDFVREAVLRRGGFRARTGRRALPTDAAGTIRQLSAIAADLRRLATIAQANGAIGDDELGTCLAQVRAAIGVFGP
jgi:hypothetical protein